MMLQNMIDMVLHNLRLPLPEESSTVDLRARYTGEPLGFVVLGDFVPYRRVRS